MSKIGIMVDCSGGLEWVDFKHNVKIVRTTINFGDEVLTDGIDITPDQFYERLKISDIIPSTSAPFTGEILSKIEEFKKDGYSDVIFFTISDGLSTYGQNFNNMKEELVEGIRVHVVNSNNACLMEGYQAYYADLLASKGYEVDEILELVDKMQKQTNSYFVVNDLKYLVKNGRLSAAAGFIGTLVSIKPILTLGVKTEGKIITHEKVRTKKLATITCVNHLIEEFAHSDKVIYSVLHSGAEEECKEAQKLLMSKANNAKDCIFTVITPTVGAHVGCGLIGMFAIDLTGLKELD